MYICNPSPVLVSRTDETVAVVTSLTDFSAALLVLVRSTARLIVSPGTTSVAATLRRLAAPEAPRAMATVPPVAVCDADVVEVKVAKVPRPATAPAAPRAARDRPIFVERFRAPLTSGRLPVGGGPLRGEE